MSHKLLTLIVPSYNMEKYLAKCCESVVLDDAALMDRLEVLIINDGSKDRTSEIGHSFEAKYPDVFHVIGKENGHYGSCVNRGVKEATGKFVKLLDADDTFDNAAFGRVMAFLNDHESVLDKSDVDLIITDHSDVHEDDKVFYIMRYPGQEGLQSASDFIAHDIPMHPSMMIVRTEMLRQIGYRQTEGVMYTDLEWGTYPMEGIRNVWYLPVILYRYLHGREGQSISPAVASRNVKVLITLLTRFAATYKLGHFKDDKRLFLRRKVASVAGQIVVNSIFTAPYHEVDANLSAVVECVSNNAPEVMDGLRNLCVLKSHPFHYFKAWEKHRHLSRWIVFALRQYSKLANRRRG